MQRSIPIDSATEQVQLDRTKATNTGGSGVQHWASALALLATTVGTGGVARPQTLAEEHTPANTSPSCCFRVSSIRRRAAVATLGEKLTFVRHYFSLNVSDLARVLRVGRPTLYSWIRGEAEPHRANQDRIDDIYEIASDWRQVTAEPIGWLGRSRSSSGQTFIEALSEERLDQAKLRAMVLGMKEKMAEAQAKVSDFDPAAALAPRAGYAEPTRDMQRENIDYVSE
jgi:DNA-binding transcriptional regulator YiaG